MRDRYGNEVPKSLGEAWAYVSPRGLASVYSRASSAKALATRFLAGDVWRMTDYGWELFYRVDRNVVSSLSKVDAKAMISREMKVAS